MCWAHRNALYKGILVVNAYYDKIENFIQDAERHRRTPRLSAISGKMVDVWAAGFLRAVADSMRDAGRNWRRCHYSTIKFRNRKIKAIWLETILQNGWLNHSNIMPKPPKYHCRRRATPPHPRDTGHLKQSDRKYEVGKHRRCWRSKKLKKNKYNWNSYPNQGCVAEASLNSFSAKLLILDAKIMKISPKWCPKFVQNR